MGLCASASNLLFFKSLSSLNITRSLSVKFTLLHGCSFSCLLYTQYYDAPVILGVFTNLFLYLLVSRFTMMRRFSGFFILAGLSVGPLINSVFQFLIATTMFFTRIPLRHNIMRVTRYLFYTIAGYFIFLSVMASSGMIPKPYGYESGLGMASNSHLKFSRRYSKAVERPEKIKTFEDHVLWSVKNLTIPDVYYEVFQGVIVNPIVVYPIKYGKKPFFSHECTWFHYNSSLLVPLLGSILFLFYAYGLFTSLRSKNRILITLAFISLMYIGFYGFAYTTLVAYLYGTQFIPFYLAITALGVNKVQSAIRGNTQHLYMRFLNCGLRELVTLTIALIAIHNFQELAGLTQFTLNLFLIE